MFFSREHSSTYKNYYKYILFKKDDEDILLFFIKI